MFVSENLSFDYIISSGTFLTSGKFGGENNSPMKILIADLHGIVREAVKSCLQNSDIKFSVIGEARDGSEILQKCNELEPDVLIMDTIMPELNGIECMRALSCSFPKIRIVALNSYHNHEHLRECIRAGINGYVLKHSLSDELKLALLAVQRGGVYIDSAITSDFRKIVSAQSKGPTDSLSERENQVLRLMAQGLSLKEIGEELQISVKTVDTYKTRLFEKLQLKNRVDLVKYAMENGILESARSPGFF